MYAGKFAYNTLNFRNRSGGASELERSPRKRKVVRMCSNPSRDRPKSLKQVVTAPLQNARQ